MIDICTSNRGQAVHEMCESLTKAVELYEKSANLGDSSAMFNLGYCYKEGDGVIKNLNQAREWYTKAAAQGDAEAQTQLDSLNATNSSN